MSNKLIRTAELDPNFKFEVTAHESARDLNYCFACGSCSAGCPIHEVFPDYNPRKLAKMIKLGLRKEVLSSDYIWYCATCRTCEQRCPQKVSFFNVLNVLKNIAAKEGYAPMAWVEQTKQVMQIGIVFPIEEKWVKKREQLSLLSLKGEGKKAKKLIESTGIDEIKPRD